MVATTDIPFAQAQRLRFIESVVLWEGAIQRHRVREVFDISANHVSKDFQLYKVKFPGNLEYDQSAKEYRAGRRFKPALASGKPDEYLALLQAHLESGSDIVLPALGSGAIAADIVPGPSAGVDRALLRDIVQAIRHHAGLRVTYASMSEDVASERRLWPHALAHSGFRWHVRAYDEIEQIFRDFVLSRITATVTIDESAPVSSSKDHEWHSFDTVDVVPHHRLSDHHKAIVAREFGMRDSKTGWVWSVRLRKCLIPYFLHRYRLDLDPAKTRIRIELRERERVMRAYHFKA